MKKTNLFYFLVLLIILTSGIYSCQKVLNTDTLETDAGIEPHDIIIVKKAKMWLAENKSYISTRQKNELNTNNLIFEWSKYDLGTNLAGQEILTVPIKTNSIERVGYLELGLVLDQDGNANGMIKEYLGNPYVGEMTLNLYTGTGRLFESGWYRADTKEMYTKQVTGIHKAKASMKTRAAMGGTLEEVYVPPPSTNPPTIPTNPNPGGNTNPSIPVSPGGGGTSNGNGSSSNSGSAGAIFNAHINDGDLPECMKSVIKILKSITGNTVADIIHRFAGTVPGYNWKIMFTAKPMEVTQFARTNLTYFKDTGEVITELNSDPIVYQYASDLSLAKTIIHESVHAYLTNLYFTDKQTILESYPQMLSRYLNQKTNQNVAQHNILVKNFIADIATTLKSYGMNAGYALPDQFYSDLAWGGLTGTQAFGQLSQQDKMRIDGIIKAEQYGNNVTTNGQTQKGRKLGCN